LPSMNTGAVGCSPVPPARCAKSYSAAVRPAPEAPKRRSI
jgi:hypothetical protein